MPDISISLEQMRNEKEIFGEHYKLGRNYCVKVNEKKTHVPQCEAFS